MKQPGSRLFTAELQRKRRNGEIAPSAAEGLGVAEVMEAIRELKAEVRDIREHLAPHDESQAAAVAAEAQYFEQKAVEVNILKTELRALAVCIEQTKLEIASLRPQGEDEDRLMVVAHELDAIVSATEGATQNILDASERIDNLADAIQAQGTDSHVRQLADEIRENIIGIFEACNFQDITGQRITKVVNTLKFVEDRINAMIDIWGAESFSGLPKPPEIDEDEERKLLNGPQLENQGITQDDIDKLFD